MQGDSGGPFLTQQRDGRFVIAGKYKNQVKVKVTKNVNWQELCRTVMAVAKSDFPEFTQKSLIM